MAEEKFATRPPQQQQQGGDTSQLQQEVRDLKNALASLRATVPSSLLPLHGGGPGEEVAETWSQAEQEAARAEE